VEAVACVQNPYSAHIESFAQGTNLQSFPQSSRKVLIDEYHQLLPRAKDFISFGVQCKNNASK
jgi:hypothetical protein